MTELDHALDALSEKPEDHKAQSGFYDLFLNSTLFVPILTESLNSDGEMVKSKDKLPLIIEAEGTDYLAFFDQQKRLNDWAETEAPCIQLTGAMLAEMTTAGLHWALNIGTDHFKQFVPDEIAWLKDVVTRCKADADTSSKSA